MLFGKKDIIGLDIGSGSIKVIQLKETKGIYTLERLGIISLDPELIVDGSILDSTRVLETIKELVLTTDIKAKNTTLSVSGHSSVIIKRITLTEVSEDELSESINFEAEQYIPFDIEDVILDFQILGLAEEEGMIDILIVAVKRDKINEYASVVKEAGLIPVVVDIDSFALENMHELNYEFNEEANVALVNIGASMINMNIIKGGVSVFTRDSSVGGNLYTEALQREFSISFEDAERLKEEGEIEGVSTEMAEPVLNIASNEIVIDISRSFDYFKDTTNYENIDEIILSGGVALIKDFPTFLAERTGTNVSVAKPFNNINIPDSFDPEYIKKIGPFMAVAVGLALRNEGDK
ncbi:competence protein A [bacterium BMS3Abin09]|nr:competence protein A [bacterium BMS3Abin09]GBE41528.1 competence protein A [bacterium BMS3Bbin09]HDH34839.1 type IV pilus assembly protein PilM [Nitrospirota bacterium]HDO67305.1 type IV pilus assembly protein PilM [Nitrospirota bacterium]HEW81479.1 type IV pilus assembly protein PilM [Nitrospirota bacterium]